jgi:hypothetical protein
MIVKTAKSKAGYEPLKYFKQFGYFLVPALIVLILSYLVFLCLPHSLYSEEPWRMIKDELVRWQKENFVDYFKFIDSAIAWTEFRYARSERLVVVTL